MVTTLFVPLYPISADSDEFSDLNGRMEILRRQREALNQLVASRLADLKNVRNHLDVRNSNFAQSGAALTWVWRKDTGIRTQVSRLSSELVSARTRQENATSYCEHLADSTAELDRLRIILASLRDSVTDGLSPFNGQMIGRRTISSIL